MKYKVQFRNSISFKSFSIFDENECIMSGPKLLLKVVISQLFQQTWCLIGMKSMAILWMNCKPSMETTPIYKNIPISTGRGTNCKLIISFNIDGSFWCRSQFTEKNCVCRKSYLDDRCYENWETNKHMSYHRCQTLFPEIIFLWSGF